MSLGNRVAKLGWIILSAYVPQCGQVHIPEIFRSVQFTLFFAMQMYKKQENLNI